MSHFRVMILTNEIPTKTMLEDIMEPYSEHLVVDRYVLKTKEDIIKEQKDFNKKYKETTYAEYLRNPKKYAEKSSREHLEYISDTFPNRVLKFNDEELYQDFISEYPLLSALSEEELEYKTAIDENGSLTCRYNPKARWDYWTTLDYRSCDIPLLVTKKPLNLQVKDIEWGRNTDWNKYTKEHPEAKETYDKLITKGDFFKPEYYQKYYPTFEVFLKRTIEFIPYSLVTPDGEWHSKGTVGWFGMSDETPEESMKWDEAFYKTYIEGNEELYVTFVDCHI